MLSPNVFPYVTSCLCLAKILYVFLIALMRAKCATHLAGLDLITVIFDAE
jgi:hypothetical protein